MRQPQQWPTVYIIIIPFGRASSTSLTYLCIRSRGASFMFAMHPAMMASGMNVGDEVARLKRHLLLRDERIADLEQELELRNRCAGSTSAASHGFPLRRS